MTRGHTADAPTDIPLIGWKDVALRVKDRVIEDRITLIAAGIAFYGLLALFPAITAVMALSGFFLEPEQVVEQLDALSGVLPEDVISIVSDQATSVADSRRSGLGFAALFGLIFALYSASRGVASLIEGLNVAYDEKETRGFIRLQAVTLTLTLILLVGMVLGLVATVAVPAALDLLDLDQVARALTTVAVWSVLVVVTMTGLSVLYRYAPCRNGPKWKWASPGAVAGCFAWIVASAGFAFYVSNFASYNESFGALGGVIVLLLWFWISALVVLLGGELNAELEAQTARDSTRGADRPMGQRGATKADMVVETAAPR